MKKITMLLMLSVFFGSMGIFESVAQDRKNDVAVKTSNYTESIVVRPGNTAAMYFNIPSGWNDWYAISVVCQSPSSGLKFLVILYKDGSILFPPEMDYRIRISFDASKNMVVFQLMNARVEDTGIYYFAIMRSTSSIWEYWSAGTNLVVTSALPMAKN